MKGFTRTFALLALAGIFALSGCNKKEEDAAGGEKAAAGDKTKSAEGAAKAGDKAGTKAPAVAQAAPAPDSADKAMVALMDGIKSQNGAAIWAFLPGSYQKDVTGMVHDFGAKIDAELYNKAMVVVGKAAKVLKEKKDFILKSKMAEQALKNPMLPPGAVEKNWDAVVGVLETIANSEIKTVDGLKKLDVGAFMAGTGSKVMKSGFAIAKDAGKDPVAMMAGFKAELVKAEGDKATVKLTPPGGGEAKEEQFAKVEGKWIPAEMAEEWKGEMEKAKQQMAAIPAQMAEAKKMAMPMLMQIDTTLDKLSNAKTQAEFDAAMLAAMAPMMQGAGAAPGMPPPTPPANPPANK